MDLLNDDQRRRLTSYHRDGDQWIEDLPGRVAELARRWRLVIGPTFRPGGDASWAARVTRATGDLAVLKIALPDPAAKSAIALLGLLDGHGAVRLLDHDDEHHASLLELCDPGTLAASTPIEQADDAAASVLPPLWSLPADSMPALPLLSDVIEQRASMLRGRADRLKDPLLHVGSELYASLATQAVPGSVLHGDANQRNVLQSARGWLAIDPRPMVGDPCSELAVWVTTRLDEVAHPVQRVSTLAARLDLPRTRSISWVAAHTLLLCSWLQTSGEPGPLDTYRTAAHDLLSELG